jgi:hypothetical protein
MEIVLAYGALLALVGGAVWAAGIGTLALIARIPAAS